MKLDHWSLRSRPLGRIEPPEVPGVCLFGNVVGHPYHLDGKEVLTTAVLHFGLDCVITKSGSEYELGEIDPAYEMLYPGARERLLQALELSMPEPPKLSSPPQHPSWTDHVARAHASPC